MDMTRTFGRPVVGMLATLVLGCASSSGSEGLVGEGPGVAQGGAQDFGQFRAILEDGQIPAPQTLDDVGFFNEHVLELPPPACAEDVCLHGELGVMGNMITGSNCTVVLLGMNTPIDPDASERLPLNLALAIDTSGSMKGQSIAYVREGLLRMLDELGPDDRVSLVGFSGDATVLHDGTSGADTAALELAIGGLAATGSTNIYEGLRTAYELVADNADDAHQNRVILLSDGEATTGITSTARIQEMSRRYNDDGISLTTIGMGAEFDPVLMRGLSQAGAGAFYYLEDPAAVQEVFEEEVKTFLIPLARNLQIEVEIDPGYALRAMYGTKLFEIDGNTAHIEIPSVQIAGRTSADDHTQGRRGGGGGIVVELAPVGADAVAERGIVGRLAMSYERIGDGEIVTQELAVASSLAPGETPSEGHFDAHGVEKAFVVLNIYVAFRLASERALWGDDPGALAVLRAVEGAASRWLTDHPDDDVADDLEYVRMFIANLVARGGDRSPPTQHLPEPWPAD